MKVIETEDWKDLKKAIEGATVWKKMVAGGGVNNKILWDDEYWQAKKRIY